MVATASAKSLGVRTHVQRCSFREGSDLFCWCKESLLSPHRLRVVWTFQSVALERSLNKRENMLREGKPEEHPISSRRLQATWDDFIGDGESDVRKSTASPGVCFIEAQHPLETSSKTRSNQKYREEFSTRATHVAKR